MLRIEDCEISSELVLCKDGASTFSCYSFPGERVCVMRAGSGHFIPSYRNDSGKPGPMPFMVLHDLDAAVAALNELMVTEAYSEWTRTVERDSRGESVLCEIADSDKKMRELLELSTVFLEIARRHRMCKSCTLEAVALYEAAKIAGGG